MKSPGSTPWRRKSMLYLLLAALCVTWTGLTFHPDISYSKFFVTSAITIALVMFVYGFDDLMDIDGISYFYTNPQLRWLTLSALAAVGSAYAVLGVNSFIAASIILLIGILYSFRYKKEYLNIRLKSYFLLKNMMIGTGWGLLVFLGSNQITRPAVLVTFMFFTMQVIIGSIIRDLDDVDEDKRNQIPTFPIVLGLPNTTVALHMMNFFSAAILGMGILYVSEFASLWALWIIIVGYRFGLIEVIRSRRSRSFILQQANILACGLVLIGRITDLWIS